MDTVASLNGMYIGEITNIDDPENRGRVMVRIEAIGEVGWCRRLNAGPVHHEQYGLTAPTIEGLQVAVFFEGGSIDNPWYMHTDGNVPTDGKMRLRFGDCVLEGEIKTSGRGVWKLYSAALGDYNYIKLDGEANKVTIKALTNIEIETIGQVNIKGALVKIQGRTVVPGAHPIK